MTCVDWGFPGFIFIVGMSIPFAIENHFKQNLSSAQTYGHIFTRTLSLWTMGLLMRNGWPGSTLLGFTPALWETIYQKFLNTFGWIGLIFIA
ncbi:MAG: heparan-alpha-glucosaminide N-acetyltransferase [Pseudomonadota bacterium]|nr:heparan-alpha-glucosaminide N-acetyltransferase [Pseudomonadota bacterium]